MISFIVKCDGISWTKRRYRDTGYVAGGCTRREGRHGACRTIFEREHGAKGPWMETRTRVGRDKARARTCRVVRPSSSTRVHTDDTTDSYQRIGVHARTNYYYVRNKKKKNKKNQTGYATTRTSATTEEKKPRDDDFRRTNNNNNLLV